MATGYLSEGVCWASVMEATDAHFQSIPPSSLTVSTTTITYLHSYIKQANGTWNFVKQSYSSTGSPTLNYSVAMPTLNFYACTLPNSPSESFSDGLILGWGIVAAMVAAWAVKAMSKGL